MEGSGTPIREFQCPRCGFTLERIEFTPDAEPDCPRCADEGLVVTTDRIISVTAAPQFVGDGWTRPDTYPRPQRGPNGKGD